MHRWLIIVLLSIPAAARGNNAFPDELEVFAPPSMPHTIVVGTNYGLVQSDDDGVSWSYLCEAGISGTLVTAYGLGPDGGLYALAGKNVLHSEDQGCGWSPVQPASNVESVSDLFADPGDADHALAVTYDSSSGAFGLYATRDRGASWSGPVLTASAGPLLGVEISRSDPSRVYVSEYRAGVGVVLHRSDDHGATFTELDHAEVGDAFPFVAAVDPLDADTVWLRLVPNASSGGDELAVSHDKGVTLTVVFTAPSSLSAFAVGEDHTVWTADRANDLWRMDPDGGAFVLGSGPSTRCLAERGGALYACGDPLSDGGFVLGESDDRGATFRPLVTRASYQARSCSVQSGVCPAINLHADGGAPSVDGGSSSGSNPTKSGCGCNGAGEGAFAGAALLLLGLRARSTRRRESAG